MGTIFDSFPCVINFLSWTHTIFSFRKKNVDKWLLLQKKDYNKKKIEVWKILKATSENWSSKRKLEFSKGTMESVWDPYSIRNKSFLKQFVRILDCLHPHSALVTNKIIWKINCMLETFWNTFFNYLFPLPDMVIFQLFPWDLDKGICCLIGSRLMLKLSLLYLFKAVLWSCSSYKKVVRLMVPNNFHYMTMPNTA